MSVGKGVVIVSKDSGHGGEFVGVNLLKKQEGQKRFSSNEANGKIFFIEKG